MAQRQIILLPLAKKDLNEIWRYISAENSEMVADIVVARLHATMGVLATAPLIGRVRKEYPDSPRSFPVRPHVIFYQPLPDRSGIEVWRIVHGARDLKNLIRKPQDDA